MEGVHLVATAGAEAHVQAEAGPVAVHSDPDKAVEVFDTISETAREALAQGATEIHVVGGLHPDLPFEFYLEMLGALLQSRGSAVDVSGVLDAIAALPGVRCICVRDEPFHPPANQVAAMLRANMDAWVDDPFITTHVGPADVEWVQRELEDRAGTDPREGGAWGLKQVALGPDGSA